jgi:hypothetical protein
MAPPLYDIIFRYADAASGSLLSPNSVRPPRQFSQSSQSLFKGAATMGAICRVIFSLALLHEVTSPTDALAYLDPGSGSMMLQLLLGGIAGVAVIIRLYLKNLLNLFRSRRKEPENFTT